MTDIKPTNRDAELRNDIHRLVQFIAVAIAIAAVAGLVYFWAHGHANACRAAYGNAHCRSIP